MAEDVSKNILYTEKVYNDCQDTKKWFEGQLELKDKEIENLKLEKANLKEELNNLYSSKSYKTYEKIKKIFKRK